MHAGKSWRGGRLGLVALAILAGLPSATASARDIVIAQVAPFSGPQAPSGKAIRAGIQLYFDSANAAGGINSAKLRLMTK